MAILGIRLKISALRPFVPGVNKHEALAGAVQLTDRIEGMLKPGLECTRIGSVKCVGVVLPPCSIIPAWSNPRKMDRSSFGSRGAACGDREIVVDKPVKAWVRDFHGRLPLRPEIVRWKSNGGVAPDVCRMPQLG